MDMEGKVQRRGAFGQFLDVAGWRVNVNFVMEEIHFQGVHELLGTGFVTLTFENFIEPGELGQVLAVDSSVLLVQPVGRDAVLGLPVHLLRADLDLDALRVRAYDGGVQALVAVGLGHGDVVLEAALYGFPLLVHKTEHGVAVLHVLDDDAEGHDVVHLVQGEGLCEHLFVDAVLVFDAAVHLTSQSVGRQEILKHGDGLFDELLLDDLVILQPLGDLAVHVRPQILEAQILEITHDVVEAEAVGQGSIDVHGLLGDALLLVRLLEVQRAHVV